MAEPIVQKNKMEQSEVERYLNDVLTGKVDVQTDVERSILENIRVAIATRDRLAEQARQASAQANIQDGMRQGGILALIAIENNRRFPPDEQDLLK